MLQLRQVARAEDQADQTDQVGEGVAEAQMILRRQQRRAVDDGVAQRVAGAHQHRRRSHRAGQHAGGQADVPVEQLAETDGEHHRRADHHQRQHQVVFAVAEENREKVGPGFHAHAENKQHKAEIQRLGVNGEVLLAEQQRNHQNANGITELDGAQTEFTEAQPQCEYHEQ